MQILWHSDPHSEAESTRKIWVRDGGVNNPQALHIRLKIPTHLTQCLEKDAHPLHE